MADMLRFRRVTGELEPVAARLDDVEFPAGEFLMARSVWLEDGTTPDGRELRQHRPVSGDRRTDGYDRLDNEILAGRRLHQMGEWGGYPPQLARLYGDESTSADPYTLFLPYRGEPLREVGANLFDDEFEKFLTGLLTALCWLASVGIAHRALNPDTVWWDSDSGVQITDLSRAAPFGAARTPVMGTAAWVPRESRPDTCFGTVGPSDDVWAAVRLIYFVRSRGEALEDFGKLADSGLAQLFNGILGSVFGPPEKRPTASDLIEYGLRRPHLVPSLAQASKPLVRGRESFLRARNRKHPGAPVPAEFFDDITWTRSRWQTAGPVGPAGPAGGAG